MKKQIVIILLSIVLFGCMFASEAKENEIFERTMQIKLPTFSLLEESEALSAINNSLYEASFRLLNTHSVDRETGFGNWDAVDYYSQATQTFENGEIVSFKMDQYLYAYHSAHGAHLFLGFVYDLNTSKVLKLNELFAFDDGFKDTVDEMMRAIIIAEDIPVFNLNNFTGVDENTQFYLTEEFLVLVFQEYEFTPYYYGFLGFEIPLLELSDFIIHPCLSFS